jgi:hypothetical protein
LQKHLLHVGEPQRLVSWPAVLIERLELAGGNLILLQSVFGAAKTRMCLTNAFARLGGNSTGLLGMA